MKYNNKNITYYSKNAETLADNYNSVPVESVHKDWLDQLPKEGMVLDVGAGSGRDARFMAAKGLNVVAVEPAEGIREVAQGYTVGKPVHWLNDSLPDLSRVFALQTKFDLILLSAVWMHIPSSQRERSLRKLSSLLKPNGKLVISLRHGACHDERTMYEVSADELAHLASRFGLTYQLLTPEQQTDELGRGDVSWQTVLLTLPDDGTGSFPLLRNIVVNDKKTSTYKIALLRSLLRIAEGHPGAVLDQTEDHVALPMGLVALYWLKLYKPLIDHYGMHQNNNTSAGLGFVQPRGWELLQHTTAADYAIGAYYSGTEQALPLYQTLKDIAATIKKNPATYTTLPGSNTAVFEVELNRTTKPTTGLTMDLPFLASLGTFYVPKHIWDSLTRFSVWIEPALVNEWAALMHSYEVNRQQFNRNDYLEALDWKDDTRSTNRVRSRVNELLANDEVACCWSGKQIKPSDYAVDHAFPFARWPNNDLWNLLPTRTAVNANKSDRLPSSDKLISSRELILHWWQQGWSDSHREFFTQANLALPNLSHNNRSFSDVFEAFSLQRDRIKDIQQLAGWG